MPGSLEFLLGLFDRDESPCVAKEDWGGEHAAALRLWQGMGFIDEEPGANPVAGCPHCEDGVPYRIGARLVCDHCRSAIDPEQLFLWRLRLPAFLAWVAAQWNLYGEPRRIDAALWQLGTLRSPEGATECFYRRAHPLSGAGATRLSAYTRAIVITGSALQEAKNDSTHPHLYLPELLRDGPPLTLADPLRLLHHRHEVRFEASTGALLVGGVSMGEVPVGSKEYFFLRCLADRLDSFVPYTDLKREVLRRSGSVDTRDEASFCHRLKSRIKQRFIPQIDQFLVTTNKADGYRLVGRGSQ